jgi:hypothetical protein
MSNLSFGIKLTESNKVISDAILRAMLPDVKKYFNRRFNQVKNTIVPTIINSIQKQPEYESLLNGTLKAQFGIPDPGSRLSNILSTIENSVIIKEKTIAITGNQIKGGIKLQMIQSDFNDLISLGDATVITEKGTDLQWLQWLLLEGDTIIISDYSFVAGPFESSRTGMGIMRYSGGSWRVPPEFAGNIKNNWITRAVDAALSEIENSIEKIFKS